MPLHRQHASDSWPPDCLSRMLLLPAAADASRGVSSLAQLQRPSYLLPGKKKNVQFHTESGEVSHRQGWAARALAVLDPNTLLMRLLDDFRAIMCLYELFAMPLRIALGTGYDRLGESRWVPQLCQRFPWQRSMLCLRCTTGQHSPPVGSCAKHSILLCRQHRACNPCGACASSAEQSRPEHCAQHWQGSTADVLRVGAAAWGTSTTVFRLPGCGWMWLWTASGC